MHHRVGAKSNAMSSMMPSPMNKRADTDYDPRRNGVRKGSRGGNEMDQVDDQRAGRARDRTLACAARLLPFSYRRKSTQGVWKPDEITMRRMTAAPARRVWLPLRPSTRPTGNPLEDRESWQAEDTRCDPLYPSGRVTGGRLRGAR